MMHRLAAAAVLAALFLPINPSHAAVISFAQLASEAPGLKVAGIRITLTGPDRSRAPIVFAGKDADLWDMTTVPSLEYLSTLRAYSGAVRFKQPVSTLTFNVEADQSFWTNRQFVDHIFVSAFSHKGRIERLKVQLEPVGQITQITITAPNISRVAWHGSNWVFQPFTVQTLTSDAVQASPLAPKDGPSVGAGVPEPTGAGILLVSAVSGLLVRRRQQ